MKNTDTNGKAVNVSKSVKDDKITLTLPNGKTLDDNYYTITVTDRNGKVQPDIDVTLKDKDNFANGVTDKNGQLILPATEHKVYVMGNCILSQYAFSRSNGRMDKGNEIKTIS